MRVFINSLTGMLFVVLMATSLPAFSASKKEKAVMEALQENLDKARPGIEVVDIRSSELDALFEADLDNGDTLLTNKKGDHIITGKILRISEDGFVDVRDERLKPERAKTLAAVPTSDTISFPPANKETKAVVHVFTDVDCGFCQKLHAHMSEFNDLGVEIRYLAFPRAGVESYSAKKLVNAWCADDKQDAMNKLKTRQKVPEAECNNPVEAQYKMGQRLGVSGTPAIYAEDGSQLGGYLTPEMMARELNLTIEVMQDAGETAPEPPDAIKRP